MQRRAFGLCHRPPPEQQEETGEIEREERGREMLQRPLPLPPPPAFDRRRRQRCGWRLTRARPDRTRSSERGKETEFSGKSLPIMVIRIAIPLSVASLDMVGRRIRHQNARQQRVTCCLGCVQPFLSLSLLCLWSVHPLLSRTQRLPTNHRSSPPPPPPQQQQHRRPLDRETESVGDRTGLHARN